MKRSINFIRKWFRCNQDYLCLKRFAVFKDLSHFELNLVYQMFHRREYQAGEIVFEQGYPLEVIYFIESGALEVFGRLHGADSRVLEEGEYIGLVDMYYEKIRSSSAKAIKDTVLLAVSRTDLQDFIKAKSQTGVKILNSICAELSSFIFEVAERSLDQR